MGDRKLPSGLTLKQETLAQLLAKKVPQREAYLKAGYKGTGDLDTQAHRRASHVLVQRRVAEIVERSAEQVSVDLAYVIGGLRDIADHNKKKVRLVDAVGNEVEKMIDAPSANKAIELLGKHLGAFIDRSQVELSTDVKRIVERLAAIVAEEVTDMAIAERIVTRLAGEIGPGGSGPAR